MPDPTQVEEADLPAPDIDTEPVLIEDDEQERRRQDELSSRLQTTAPEA